MSPNEILRILARMLDADAGEVARIAALAGSEETEAQVEACLRRADEPGWAECGQEFLARFLDGLVIHRRGRDEASPPRPIETPVTNNMVLKKLRAAFKLKDEDMHIILDAADLELSKQELNSMFRKADNRHYRECNDELLEALLEGMAMCGYGAAPAE